MSYLPKNFINIIITDLNEIWYTDSLEPEKCHRLLLSWERNFIPGTYFNAGGAASTSITYMMIQMVITFFGMNASVILYGAPAVLQYSTLPPGRLIFYSCAAGVGVLQSVFGCMLIHGTFRKRPQYLWPWLVLSWLECAALAALSVAGTVLLKYNRRLEDNAEISAVIAVYFLISIILFYFVSVVSSRRQQMVQDDYKYLSKRLVKRNTGYYY